MFFPQACLVGYQNSACEHKGDHSKEIPDPTGSPAHSCPVQWLRMSQWVAARSAKSREPKLAVPYKGNRETFTGFLIGFLS